MSLLLRSVAALVVAVALGVTGSAYFAKPQMREFSTAVGAKKTITFAEGTEIELNTDTEIRTRITAEERRVELLRGEAYFHVRHDASNPFTVHVAGHRIIDLGTQFVVRTDKSGVKVSLVEGRAQFEIDGNDPRKQVAVLTPGDVLLATANTMSVTKKPSAQISTALSWRRGLLVFHYTPLGEAVQEINRYNDRKLVITDPWVARRTIYGTIPTRDVQAFMRVAQNILGLHVQAHGQELIVSR